ncbi:universal stress protein, partial [uncultured Algibacter sp.]|uniref:universal stress protein n=1 Tax=uncultured Algibacter sp. TaxID=298659 RepID=UPI0025F22DF3
MKKIIIPVDFSDHSEYALKTAAKLAKKHDADLLVLHMLEMSDIMLTTSEGFQSQKAAFFLQIAEQKLEGFLKKDYLNDLKVTSIIKHFKVFSEVNDVALKNDADLIVMGSHGSSGMAEFFVGSNTERVVRNANIPVLVVKNNVSDVNFNVVAFACSFSEETIKPYLNAVKMFDKIDTKFYLVHVNLPNDRFMSSLEIEQKAVNFFTKAERNLTKMKDVYYVCDYTVE